MESGLGLNLLSRLRARLHAAAVAFVGAAADLCDFEKIFQHFPNSLVNLDLIDVAGSPCRVVDGRNKKVSLNLPQKPSSIVFYQSVFCKEIPA